MTRPLISFITSCKGRLRHLSRTFRSVAHQGGADGEYVMVDYGCPDASGKWVEDQGIEGAKVVRPDPSTCHHFNQPRARNLGAAAAEGDYFCFIDGDTAIQPGFFEKFSPYLKPRRILISEARGGGHGGFFIIHRDAFAEIGGFDESYDGYGSDDTDFLLACDRAGLEIRTIAAFNLEPFPHPGSDRIRYIPGSLAEAAERNHNRFEKKWGFRCRHEEIFHELYHWPHPVGNEFLTARGRTGMAPLVEKVFRDIEGGAHSDTHMAAHMPMLHVLATQSPGPIVECGTRRGYSTLALLSGALPLNIPMTSYDPNPECERWVKARCGPALRDAFDKHELDKQISAQVGADPPISPWRFFPKLSWDAAADWGDESVGLWFLDTSHTREDTIRELDAWLPKMMPDGIMCGHDYWIHRQPGNEACNVKDPVDAFARKHRDRFDLQTFEHDFGFFILWPRT